MEYEFVTDAMGCPQAHFSMGHEAFGHWFSNELGDNVPLTHQLCAAIARAYTHPGESFTLNGREYSLQIVNAEVSVSANALALEDDSLADELDYYDAESVAHCGLEDFDAALNAWRQFVTPD